MQGRRRALGWMAAGLLAVSAVGCDDATTANNATTDAANHTPASAANNVNLASIDLTLARTKLCLACHQVDRQLVGPSFLAIARRYADSDGALDYLAMSIRDGGQGRWGALTMPRQPQVSPAEARKLAQWLLDLVPDKTADPAADKPAK